MTLLDRMQRQVGVAGGKIPGHIIEDALTLYFHGRTGVDRQKLLDAFSVTVGMEADFDQLKQEYDDIVGAAAKEQYLMDLMSSISLLQHERDHPGDGLTKAQFNTVMGLALDAT